MRPESLELESKSHVSVSQSILQKLKSRSPNGSGNASTFEEEFLGGVIRGGQLAWIAHGSNIEVVSLRTGQRVAGHSFDEKCNVTCVAEVTVSDINSCLLIIGVQRMPVGGLLYLFSVQGSRIVRRIDIVDKITSCCFVSDAACKRGCLKAFNGCAAVGTEAGEVYLIDLNLNHCKELISRQKAYNPNSDESSCKIITAPNGEDEIRPLVKQTRNENINLGIRLDVSVIEQPSPVSSILSMPQMQMIVIGLESGLLALFNLCDLNALHLAFPPEIDSPLVKLTFLEPADDPRPCVYIWAFHANQRNFPYAVMHSISFNSKTYQDGENIYETFQWCRADLTIPIHERESTPISCQSITKIVADEEEDQYSLCLLAWTNKMSSFVLVFDLNQWYKEQMPRVCDWRDYPSYLAPFPIENHDIPLDIWLNPKSVETFNSIQRPEEHFHPTSLSFDLVALNALNIHKLHWAGLQNNAIKKLNNTGAIAILVPDDCFSEFLEASLIPQLSDRNYHANPSKKMKQEFLLSMALEYNSMSLLRECAQQWADGSHMGRGLGDALTLSTLTDWIWNQATLIKDRCNDLCVSLFDDSGITIDLRSRKILAHYSRQLKLLADLLHMIITNYRQYIPDEIFDTLTAQRNSIRMTSEYQEVLQWLLNMGLLPEIVWNQLSLPEARNDTFTAIPYPYRILNKFYTEQRQRFYDIDRNNIAPKTNSCKCLYIDSFIDRECNSHLLRNEWNNGSGDGLYPPPSLQAMLRILLTPGISLENKYMLFVYLFLDLHMVLEGEHFNVVQNLIKFPAVFKLNSSLIKTTQAFWNLDHNEYEIALKELISPLTSDRFISQWQQELLVNTLLLRDMPNLALQAIRAPGPSINTSLRIKTLLTNNLITEAFELQRSKFDENILLEFFKGCHEQKKWNYVLGLSLTEREGETLCKFLKNHDSLLSENLQLLYLLQRNKYIDALTYLDDLKHKQRTLSMHRKLGNTQDLIISSYKMAMNTTNRTLCDQYMTIKHRLQVDVQQNTDIISPLSSQLNPHIMDANANVVGSVFHRAIVAAKRTGFDNPSQKSHIPLLGNLRIEFDAVEVNEYKPILEPKPYVGILKRRKEISYENNADPDQKQPAAKRQRTDSFSVADFPLKKSAPGINSFLMNSLTNQSQAIKKQLSQQDLDETVEIDNEKRNSLGELCDTVNLLSTPVVKSSRLERHSRIESRCQTPQSILKQRHTEIGSIISRRSTSPSLTVNSAKRSVDFNAKPFCYTIPSQNDDIRLGAIEETANVQDDDDSSSANSPNSIKGRRAIHSRKNSTTSNSIDEFYSPETSKVHEESIKSNKSHEDIGNDDLSRIDVPTTNIKTRRGLRSKTPELVIMSSTRITRSRSKLNLEDSADYEDVAKQPVLNTSTPKRTTPTRSSSKSLTKNVLTTNALKLQSEVDNSIRVDEPKFEEYIASPVVDSDVNQRNFLKDASYMSAKRSSLAYSIDELDATQAKQNLLQDSSSFASESEFVKKVSETLESTQERNDSDMQVDEQISDQNEEKIDENTAEHSNIKQSIETVENEPEAKPEIEEITEIASTEPENVATGEQQPTVETTETVSEQTTIREIQKLPGNYLVDSSVVVNESIMQKFTRYEHYTSSFFSDSNHAQNLLEDSSMCTPATTQQTADTASIGKDVVNIDDFDDESKTVSSSNNTISSETGSSDIEGDLIYEESDIDERENNRDNEVIQISSSSEADQTEDIVSESQDQPYADYEDLQYDVNDEFTDSLQPQTVEYDVDEYNITEFQSASMRADISPGETSAQSQIQVQEQAMNEMIYGDLGAADAEMLDLDVDNDAIGFEMHGERVENNQDDVYLEAVEIVTTSNVPSERLLLKEPSSVEQNQENKTETAENTTDEVSNQKQSQENIVEENAAIDEKVEESDVIENIQTIQESEIVRNESPANVQDDHVDSNEETNVFAAFMSETPVANVTESVQQQPKDTNVEPMDATEMKAEPTNVFSVLATTPIALEVTESILEQVENVPEENAEKMDTEKHSDTKATSSTEESKNSPEKMVEKAIESERPKTPSRRTRRVSSQDNTNVVAKEAVAEKKSKADVPDVKTKLKLKKSTSELTLSKVNEAESKLIETKSKTRRARAQSQNVDESDRKEGAVFVNYDFKIILNRNDVGEVVNVEKSEPAQEESKRKKRGVSQQKEVKVKHDTTDEQSTEKTTKRQRTKSGTDHGLGDKFDAEESVPSRRLRKATSHQSLSDAVEATEEPTTKRAKSPGRKKSVPKTPQRAASHQSLSSISDEEPMQKNKRNKSVSMQDLNQPSTSRSRRAASQQRLDDIDEKEEVKVQKRRKLKSESNDSDSELGERFDANETAPSRRLRKAVSHQTLSKINESEHEESPAKKGKSTVKKEPVTPRTTRRATSIQSLSSIISDETQSKDGNESKTRSRKRTKSDSSDKLETENTSPRTRSRRVLSESKQSTSAESAKESRKKSTRSSKKDDDTHSEASSIVSTRSRKLAANTDDDTSSVKSTRVRATRSGPILPVIAENEDQEKSIVSQDYLETSRLTRSQRATIEKYAKIKGKTTDAETIKRTTRKTKAETNIDEQQAGGYDHSDSESILSQKSAVSKISKKSKTSEASTSQRSTRQRTSKK